MTIGTITISSIIYPVYASRDEVDEYLAVDAVRSAVWAALTDDDDTRGPFIVAATRRLDLLQWQGTKTGGDDVQTEDWPRTGLSYPDGAAVSTVEVPVEVQNAVALLAGSIAIKAAVADSGTSGTNTKSVKAGSAAVSFFRRNEGKPLQDETAYDLVKQFLEATSTGAAVGPLATGTGGSSTFTDIDNWGRNAGFP